LNIFSDKKAAAAGAGIQSLAAALQYKHKQAHRTNPEKLTAGSTSCSVQIRCHPSIVSREIHDHWLATKAQKMTHAASVQGKSSYQP
jgi:hypothetical protein